MYFRQFRRSSLGKSPLVEEKNACCVLQIAGFFNCPNKLSGHSSELPLHVAYRERSLLVLKSILEQYPGAAQITTAKKETVLEVFPFNALCFTVFLLIL
mmetsp:Transcript_43060/g.79895  ORF Transcript_43060/g.79895 Transcript_43060/m.79895 type:complete len:99 (-) Transcript_43060:397-693(-)